MLAVRGIVYRDRCFFQDVDRHNATLQHVTHHGCRSLTDRRRAATAYTYVDVLLNVAVTKEPKPKGLG